MSGYETYKIPRKILLLAFALLLALLGGREFVELRTMK